MKLTRIFSGFIFAYLIIVANNTYAFQGTVLGDLGGSVDYSCNPTLPQFLAEADAAVDCSFNYNYFTNSDRIPATLRGNTSLIFESKGDFGQPGGMVAIGYNSPAGEIILTQGTETHILKFINYVFIMTNHGSTPLTIPGIGTIEVPNLGLTFSGQISLDGQIFDVQKISNETMQDINKVIFPGT